MQALARHQGEDAKRFCRRDRVHVQTDCLRRPDLALEEPPLIAARRDAEAADLVPVLGRPRLGLQAPIEPDAVLTHAHQNRRGVEVGDHPGGVPGRAAGQLAFVDEHHVRPALLRQVIRDAAPGDAASYDDDASLVLHATLLGGGRRRRRARAGGIEWTTLHACATPLRLGSIRALESRRRVAGTGPFDPSRTHPPPPAPPVIPRSSSMILRGGRQRRRHAWVRRSSQRASSRWSPRAATFV